MINPVVIVIAYPLATLVLVLGTWWLTRKHQPQDGPPIPERTDELGRSLRVFCTCGHPAEHRQGCPRRPQWMDESTTTMG